MQTLFKPYGEFAVVTSTPGGGSQPYTALFCAWRIEELGRGMRFAMQGEAPGLYETEAAARYAAMAAARLALDQLKG